MHDHLNDPAFLAAMAALGDAVSQDLSDTKLKIYAKALEDIPVADIERACWRLIRTRTTATFPKVGEIHEAVHGRADDQAMLALEKLENTISRIGGYDSVIFDDPVIHATIQAFGGWIALCDLSKTDEWTWARKEWLNLYEAKLRAGYNADAPPVLIGRAQAHNEEKGYAFKPPVLIGDKQKALAWSKSAGRCDTKALPLPEMKSIV